MFYMFEILFVKVRLPEMARNIIRKESRRSDV